MDSFQAAIAPQYKEMLGDSPFGNTLVSIFVREVQVACDACYMFFIYNSICTVFHTVRCISNWIIIRFKYLEILHEPQ